MRRLKKDNRGMTLIELLIAITILGLVAAPLLHGFLTSAQTEVKARKMGEVTSVAQNVMETIEGNEFEEITADGSTVFGVTSSVIQNGEDYKVSIPGVASYPGGRTYNATVDIKPLNEINNTKLSDYTSMDVVFQVEKSEVKHDRIITLTVTKSGSEIKFELEDDTGEADEPTGDQTTGGTTEGTTGGTTGGGTTEETNPTPPPQLTGGSPGTTVGRDNLRIYTQTSEGEMPSVYLFYYPSYKTDGGTPVVYKDTIKIVNKQDLKFDLFLIKQQDTGMTWTNLDACEIRSKCQVEQHLSGTYSRYSNKIGVNLYTNILERLSYTVGHTNERTMPSTAVLDYDFVCGSTPTYVDGSLQDDASNFLVKEKSKKRAYEYTVNVFIDEADVLSTMTGTILK